MMKPKVLMIAFALSPKRGGEAALGWNMAREIAKHVDLTVVSASRDHKIDYRADMSEYLASGNTIDFKVKFINPPKSNGFYEYFHELGFVMLYHFWYINYQRWMYEVMKGEIRNYDYVHQLNMIGFRYPGFFWKAGKPFIWGPVGGLAQFPVAYLPHVDRKSALRLRLRNWLNERSRSSRIVRRATTASSHIFCATVEAKRFFDRTAHCPVTLCPETGAQVNSIFTNRARSGGRRLQVGWAGVSHPRKMPNLMRDLVVQATNCDFHICGEGSNLLPHGQYPHVSAHGILPRDQFLVLLRDLDILLHTSLLEGSPHVVAEALAAGVPTLAHNCCGMALMVDESCGVLIEVIDYDHSLDGFKQALNELSNDAAKLDQLKRGAEQMARSMGWEGKADQLVAAYVKQ